MSTELQMALSTASIGASVGLRSTNACGSSETRISISFEASTGSRRTDEEDSIVRISMKWILCNARMLYSNVKDGWARSLVSLRSWLRFVFL
jgi:hypothetical protein